MLWTPELAQYLEDAPWPATKGELIDYCERIGQDNSSNIPLGNSSHSARMATLFVAFSILLIGGCASDRSSEKHRSDASFFDSPDVESLH